MIQAVIAVATAASIIASLFGKKGDTFNIPGATKPVSAANLSHDVGVNGQHALNFFNNNYNLYQNYITPDEWSQLEDAIIPRVDASPGGYYGGLGTSYNSKYTQKNTATVPAVGIVQDLDRFIDAKIASQAATPSVPSSGTGTTGGATVPSASGSPAPGQSLVPIFIPQAAAPQTAASLDLSKIDMPKVLAIGAIVLVGIIFLTRRN